MKNFQHLTKNQILAYSDDSLNEFESQEIGRHLLNCEICRQSLPIPTVEQFWSAIMNDKEEIEKAGVEKTVEVSSEKTGFSSFLNFHSNLIWSGATLIVLISFSFLIWLNIANSNREVAVIINTEMPSEEKILLPTWTPSLKVPTQPNSNRGGIVPVSKQPKTEAQKPTPPTNKVVPKLERKELNKKEQISEIRGVSNNCLEEKSVELEFSTNKESFVFKWKKVPKAVKYHLYISDDEEILIDEFETEAETTFVLKKSLDPLKSYKWKIIVTLENGKTLISSSQKFKVNNFQKNPVRFNDKKTADGRCLASE